MAVVFSMREPSGATDNHGEVAGIDLGKKFGVQTGQKQRAGDEQGEHRSDNDQRFEAEPVRSTGS